MSGVHKLLCLILPAEAVRRKCGRQPQQAALGAGCHFLKPVGKGKDSGFRWWGGDLLMGPAKMLLTQNSFLFISLQHRPSNYVHPPLRSPSVCGAGKETPAAAVPPHSQAPQVTSISCRKPGRTGSPDWREGGAPPPSSQENTSGVVVPAPSWSCAWTGGCFCGQLAPSGREETLKTGKNPRPHPCAGLRRGGS